MIHNFKTFRHKYKLSFCRDKDRFCSHYAPGSTHRTYFLLYLTNDPERSTLSGSCLFKLVPRELFSSITRGPEDEVCIYKQRFFLAAVAQQHDVKARLLVSRTFALTG